MGARISAALVVIGLVASADTMAQQLDFGQFSGYWKREEDKAGDCRRSLKTNIIVAPREIKGYFGEYAGVVTCQVKDIKRYRTDASYSFRCRTIHSDGTEYISSNVNIVTTMSRDRMNIWADGSALNGVYIKCPKVPD